MLKPNLLIQSILSLFLGVSLVSCQDASEQPIAALGVIGDGTYTAVNEDISPAPFKELFDSGLVPAKTFVAVTRDDCKPAICFAEPKGDPDVVVRGVEKSFQPTVQDGNDHIGALRLMCDLFKSERLPRGRLVIVIGSDFVENPCKCNPAPLESFVWPRELKSVELFVYGVRASVADTLMKAWAHQLDHSPRFFPPGRKPDWGRDLGLKPSLGL